MPVNNERILPETRVVAAVITPVLILAFLILYVFPDSNGEHFSWFVRPRMSSMMLGAVYLTGALFFGTVLFARHWHQVRIGFLPVTAFATLMGVATLFHWDKFNHNHPAFWLWAVLYSVTPFLIPLVWLRNQAVAPGPQTKEDKRFPIAVMTLIGIVGFSGLLVGSLLFLLPGLMTSIWPWSLTPLTARVTGAEFVLFGAFGLLMLKDRTWESVRIPLRFQLASPVLFLVAIGVARNDLSWSNFLAWVFLFNVAVPFMAGVPLLYFFMERREAKEIRQKQAD